MLPVLELLRRAAGRRAVAVAADFCRRPGAIYVFALPLVVSQVALRSRFPSYQDWADIATYTLVFLAGYVLASERRLEAAIRANVRIRLIAGVLSTAGVGILLLLANYRPANQELRDVAFSTLWSLMIWSWLVVVPFVSMQWLDWGNRVTAYLAESILPFYVLHHPVVVFVASVVIALRLGLWSKFALVVAISMATTLVLYELLVRRWAVTRLVFGLKPRPRASTRRAGGAAPPPDALLSGGKAT